jgi:hypothetical protein
MNIADRHIWIFKEARSGSEWICSTLEKRLMRNWYTPDTNLFLGKDNSMASTIVDSNIDVLSDLKCFYATHYFFLLPEMRKMHNPYLVRTTRRNKAEHCMSLLYYKMFAHIFKHMYQDSMIESRYATFLKTLEKPVTILKQEVLFEMKKIQKYDKLWNEYSKGHDTYVIVYEDLEDGVNFPLLKEPLKFSDDETYVKKTPYYKDKFFANYEEIIEWCKYYEKELGLDTY